VFNGISLILMIMPSLYFCVFLFLPTTVVKDEAKSELGLYDELKEACIAAENLMKRALNESSRRQKADGEVASALQKVQFLAP
jgi:hypothetical protein